MFASDVEKPSFEALQKDPRVAQQYIDMVVEQLQSNGILPWIYQELAKESSRDPEAAYPGQGLRITGWEEGDRDAADHLELMELDAELFEKTIHAWLYYVGLFNHDDRLEQLFKQSDIPFRAPKAIFNLYLKVTQLLQMSVTINDLRLNPSGSHQPRAQRSDLHKRITVSYGRKLSVLDQLKNKLLHRQVHEGRFQARNVIVGAANPEITGSPMALATLAQTHSLVCVPRDGLFADARRQAALVEKTLEWFERSPVLIDKPQSEQEKLKEFWQHNLVGVLEAKPAQALPRAEILYQAGIRTFRIYSPEPSSGPLETLKSLRSLEKEQAWEPIELFAGQVVDVKQAKQLERAGANALYFGIGGGGRCITGVVAGLTINWPQLIWRLRGKIRIPMIVEGGANDHAPETLALGASGIGAAGKLGGTIETPGGRLFVIDPETGEIFKFYGGEASDRMRVMAGRGGPLGFVLNREGETRRKDLRNGGHDLPTLAQVQYEFMQGIVAGLVFQNVRSIAEFQDVAGHQLRRASPNDDAVGHTH